MDISAEEKAKRITDKMMSKDAYSQWLGIERLHDGPGACKLKLKVRAEMLNGFSIAHGGISYALADSALAFAANSHGQQCVSVETSISHTQKVFENDILSAEAKEISLNNKIGIYHVSVRNQHDVEIAIFKGTVYRSSKGWEV